MKSDFHVPFMSFIIVILVQIILVSTLTNIFTKTKAKYQSSSKLSAILNFVIDLQQEMITITCAEPIIKILEDNI